MRLIRTYTEEGAVCDDDVDADKPATVGGDTVDTSTVGQYTVTYDCTDSSNNEATQVSRTVNVQSAPDTTLPADAFVTTWKTASADQSITINFVGDDMNISWGDDGMTETNLSGSQTHTYINAGNYTVSVTGGLTGFHLNDAADASKLVSLDQWGNTTWTTMENAFYGADNMAYNAADSPDLSSVTNMNEMFAVAISFNGDLSSWDVSKVTDMFGMFNNADSFNGNLSSWDVSAVTDMSSMFDGATDFNGDLSSWDVSSVTDMNNMFYYATSFNQPLNDWDVSSVTEMDGMFFYTPSFTQNLGNWYVVANATSIARADVPGVVAEISAQNDHLNGHNPTYGIGSDNDYAFFEIVNGNKINMTSVGTKSSYMVNVTASGSNVFEDGNNWRLLEIKVTGQTTDTTSPVIKLEGSSLVTITVDDTYTELGATCEDNVDADKPATVGGDTVDTSTAGQYTVTYDCTDSSNNEATQVSRTVNVQSAPDTDAPVIIITGSANIQLTVDDTYTEQGATCEDNVDADKPATVGGDTVDTSTVGQYTVTYDCTDSSNNEATQVSRTVNVQSAPDTDAPVIIITGSANIQLTVDETYTEEGAVCDDDVDADKPATVGGDTVDTSTVGQYTVTYDCTDSSNNEATQVSRTVNVQSAPDTTLPADAFVTTWKTASADQSITINFVGDDMNISWGDDGMTETNLSGSQTHTYINAGNYTVSVTGGLTGFHLNDAADASKLVSLDQWGNTTWTTMENAFYGADNMAYNAADSPDLSSVTNMNEMFAVAISFNGDLSSWDVSKVTDMFGMFSNADSFNGNLSSWDVSAVTDMSSMFDGATDFNGDLSSWDVSSVTDMNNMFYYATSFNQPLNDWDVSSVTEMDGMFFYTPSFTQNLGNWYVVANATSIARADVPGVVAEISAQNDHLNGHNPTYGIGSDNDYAFFEIVNGNKINMTSVGTKSSYMVNVTASGSNVFEDGNNWRLLEIKVTGQTTDTTSPVIKLEGSSLVTITVDDTYTELGATCEDNVDADKPATVGGDTVDTSTAGQYTVTYDCTDSSNNEATQVSRTVNVQSAPDTDAPVIIITGSANIQLTVDDTYTEQGATCEDNVDADKPATVGGDTVDTSTVGQYTVTYDCTDSSNNEATQVSRTVNVQSAPDTDAPVIIITGSANIQLTVDETYTEEGAVCDDDVDADKPATVGGDTVDTSTAGQYTVTYDCTDSSNNEATQVSRTVNVQSAPDTTLPADAFVTTWKTASADQSITINFVGDDMNISWGDDGMTETNLSGSQTHTYINAGNYTVSVTGGLTGFHLNDAADASKLVSLDQWGNTTWTTMENAFYGADNMAYNAADSPDLSSVTNMNEMFAVAISFNGDLSSWDVSKVTDMFGMFNNADSFNGNLSSWDVSAVTDMSSMFDGATDFNGDLSSWDVSSVTDMNNMFYYATSFNQPLNDWDVSSVTEMDGMFFYTPSFTQNLGNWYVVANATSIARADVPGVVAEISAQNDHLNGHNPTYGIGSDNDYAFFEIVNGNKINMTSVGTKSSYMVNVTASGSNVFEDGNNWRLLEIKVTGQTTDTTSPVIKLEGSSLVTITVDDTYTEQGAVCDDDVDADKPATVGGDTVDTSTVGQYTVTYDCTYSSNNEATQVSRTVNVQSAPDTDAPVIMLTGLTSIQLTVDDTYTEQGAVCDDDVDADKPATVGGDTVDTSTVGQYTVTYDCTDTAGNVATQVLRTVNVQSAPDTDAPVIMFTGLTNIQLTVDDTYTEQGAVCDDDVDADKAATVGGDTVDTSTVGQYTVTYDCTDSSNNEATQVSRTVNVQSAPDTDAPVIIITGLTNIQLTVGDTYTEEGAVCDDDVDADKAATVGGDTVDISTVGQYTVTYDCTDSSNNEATQVSRTVNVQSAPDTDAPVIIITGSANIQLTVGDTYTEEGATCDDDVDADKPATVGGDTVDTSTVGQYIVTYDCTDSSNNEATQVSRTVNVVST